MTLSISGAVPRQATLSVLVALSVTHLLNDTIQSLIPAIYPIIKQSYQLDYIQIGLITLTFQVSASLLQPCVGFVTDRHPMPYSMVAGMTCSLIGLIALAYAGSYGLLLLASAFVGLGSSIFHPEATRVARNASGGRHGLAQAVFQIGGQTGSALGPLLAAFVIVPFGQTSLARFSVAAFVAILLMIWIARSDVRIPPRPPRKVDVGRGTDTGSAARPSRSVIVAVAVLIILLFSKYAYTASFTSFYTFYLMGKFGISIQTSQVMLFLFLASSAAGALGGGIVGDRIGRKPIIWFSILGALPFTLIVPYADLFWTGVLTIVINLIMSSAFAAILIYALELLPGRVGLVSGFFYGVTFGVAGIAAALLGALADQVGIETVYRICSYLPAMGLLAWFLPRLNTAADV